MRTAKQWAKDIPTNVNSDDQCVPLIRRIQTDALRHAATICLSVPTCGGSGHRLHQLITSEASYIESGSKPLYPEP